MSAFCLEGQSHSAMGFGKQGTHLYKVTDEFDMSATARYPVIIPILFLRLLPRRCPHQPGSAIPVPPPTTY